MKHLLSVVGTAALLLAAASSHAQTEEQSSAVVNRLNLESNSPFIPPGWTPPQPRRAEAPPPREEPPPPPLKIELRGVVDFGDGPRFGLHDPDRGRAFWIGPGEEYNGVRIVDFDDDFKSITVAHSGRQSELKLSKRSDTPVEVVSAPQPVTAQAAPAEGDTREARREAWRRRQEEREAQEGGPPPGAAQMREAFRNASPEEREALWRRIGRAVQDFQSGGGGEGEQPRGRRRE